MVWPALRPSVQAGLAETADEAQARGLDLLAGAGGQAGLPPRNNRKVLRGDEEARSKARHLLEHGCATRKPCSGIATRDAKRANTCLGAVSLAAAVIWLN